MSLKVILTSAIRRRIAEIEEAEARESDAPSSDPLTTITPIEILKVGLADTLVCAVRGQRAARLGQLPVRAHAVARVVDWESRQRRARRRAS
jgi:hypothetical protein